MKVTRAMVVVLVLAAAVVQAQPPSAVTPPDWSGFEFLIGDFVAAGGGVPGAATGSTSLHPVMNGTALERTNSAEYPAANGRPAFVHEDRLYIYLDPQANALRGLYFDPEGHVILYRVAVDASKRRIQMVSDPIPGQPRYRFTYTSDAADEFDTVFEIAPPDDPEHFASYVGGKAKRIGKGR
jgi:hypothetical protein